MRGAVAEIHGAFGIAVVSCCAVFVDWTIIYFSKSYKCRLRNIKEVPNIMIVEGGYLPCCLIADVAYHSRLESVFLFTKEIHEFHRGTGEFLQLFAFSSVKEKKSSN